jgi:hypothetical protein
VISGPQAITEHLDALIEMLESGDADEALMRAHQVLFDFKALRAYVPDRTAGKSGLIVAAFQLKIDTGKLRDLDESLHSVIDLLNSEQIDAALEECEAARERWLAPKEE